jgi:nucleolar protein 12
VKVIDDEKIYGHFKKCGSIDYVRVIRDNRTGIGKGIGYVVFKTSDSVNLALKLNNSEIDNRKIRVERCVKKKKLKKDGKHQSSAVEEKSKTKSKQKTITVGNPKTNKQTDRKYSKKTEGVKKYDKKIIERKKMNKIKTNSRPTNKFKF